MPFGVTPLKKKSPIQEKKNKKTISKSSSDVIGGEDATTFIKQGIEDMENLTKAAEGNQTTAKSNRKVSEHGLVHQDENKVLNIHIKASFMCN